MLVLPLCQTGEWAPDQVRTESDASGGARRACGALGAHHTPFSLGAAMGEGVALYGFPVLAGARGSARGKRAIPPLALVPDAYPRRGVCVVAAGIHARHVGEKSRPQDGGARRARVRFMALY